MKKQFFLAIAIALSASMYAGTPIVNVNNAEQTVAAEDEYNKFPWDFPSSQTIEANEGDWALSCSQLYNLSIKRKKNLLKDIMIYYDEKVSKVTADSVIFTRYGRKESAPSSLVIPIPAGQKAKKGDIVLTWWQSGSGKSRAIVIDDANPAQPKVCYLDFDWKGDGTGIAETKQDELKPNSFFVLKKEGEWKPGHQVAHKDGEHQTGSILAVTKDKVLWHGFSDKIYASNRADLVLVPYKEKIKKGDAVSVYWLGKYKSGYTVLEVDEVHGRYKCAPTGKDDAKYYSFYEVTKLFN